MKKLKSIFSKFDFIIIIISIVTLFIVLNLPFKAKPFGDDTFHLEAKKIALYIKGNVSFDQVTITKAPGPVLFYTIVYVLVPSDASDNTYWSYAVIFTSILLIISMLLIFRICKCMFSSNIGFLSVVLFFLFPIHFYYSLGILAEVPAFFSLTIALFGWSKVFKRVNDKTGWALFILGSCFLILNRPNALLLLPISLAIVFYAYFRNKLFFNKFGLKIMTAVFIIGFLSFAFLEF
jgi:4-amino-4-deoxy-L-arabinose transferase-like glycosyltransferase